MKRNQSSKHLFSTAELLESRRLFAVYGPDVTFGHGGRVALTPGFIDPLANGKTIVATSGYVYDPPEEGGDSSAYERTFTRLNSDGTSDGSFATSGKAIADDVEIAAADSRVYLVGYYSGAIEARTGDWNLDNTFSSDGRASVPAQVPSGAKVTDRIIFSVTAAPGGGIIVDSEVDYTAAGQSRSSQLEQLVKINVDGSQDMSFGTNGAFNLPASSTTFRVLPSGLYLYSATGIQRYSLHGGLLDPSFGTGGSVEISYKPYIYGEVSGGRLIYSTTRSGITRVYRRNADGSSDTTFAGGAGSFALPRDATQSITIDPQGRIVVAANDRLYRYSTDGILEAAPFNGTTPVEVGQTVFDAQARILVAGSSVTRYDFSTPIALGADHTIYFTGDSADDVATVSLSGKRIVATLNGSTITFPQSSVTAVNLRLGDGNNRVTISATLPASVTTAAGTTRSPPATPTTASLPARAATRSAPATATTASRCSIQRPNSTRPTLKRSAAAMDTRQSTFTAAASASAKELVITS